jgi:hypothetical protein
MDKLTEQVEADQAIHWSHRLARSAVGAISTLVSARLTTFNWSHHLSSSQAVKFLKESVSWWSSSAKRQNSMPDSVPEIAQEIEKDKRFAVGYRDAWMRLFNGKNFEGLSLHASALEWCVHYSRPYDTTASVRDKADLRQRAIQKIANDPKSAIVLLWLSEKYTKVADFCVELFAGRNETIPPALAERLDVHIFKGKIRQEKIAAAWRVVTLFFLDGEARQQALENFFYFLDLFVFSFEEKKIISSAAFDLADVTADVTVDMTSIDHKIQSLSQSLPLYMQDYLWAYIDDHPSLSFEAVMAHDRRAIRLDQIRQSFGLSHDICTTERHSRMIFCLQQMAADSTKLPFQIQVFSPQETSSTLLFPFVQLPQELVLRTLQFINISDHLHWSLVSKACYAMGKTQNYWCMRCGADFGIVQSNLSLWSQAYQEAYYLRRWIPKQFQKAVLKLDSSWRLRLHWYFIYSCLALNEQQWISFLSKEAKAQIDDKQELKQEIWQMVNWLREMKEDRTQLLNFFNHLLFKTDAYAQDDLYPDWQWEDGNLHMVSMLCVDGSSLISICHSISEALPLSHQWDNDRQRQFFEDLSEIASGFLERFSEQAIGKVLLTIENSLKREKLKVFFRDVSLWDKESGESFLRFFDVEEYR